MARTKGAKARNTDHFKPSFDIEGPASPPVQPNTERISRISTNGPRSSKRPFSLQDEAKITQSRFTHADSKLRANRIAFVSAGTSSGEDLTEAPEHSPSVASILPKGAAATAPTKPVPLLGVQISELRLAELDSYTPVDLSSGEKMPSSTAQLAPSQPPAVNDMFFVDVEGSSNLVDHRLSRPVIRRSPSPTDSISSEEVILFEGRSSSHFRSNSYKVSPWLSKRPIAISEPVTHGLEPENVSCDQFLTAPADASVTREVTPSLYHSGDQPQLMSGTGKAGGKLTHSPRKPKCKNLQSAMGKDATLADYIANMNADDAISSLAPNALALGRQLDVMDTDGWQHDLDDSQKYPRTESNTSYSARWGSPEMEAFDDLSTSNELVGKVQRIVSKRKRPSGPQYLVVPEGYTVDDARWISVTLLDGSTAQEKIRLYEFEQAQLERHSTNSESDLEGDQDDLITWDLQEDMDDIVDEQGLLDRIRARMTDEQLARLFSKQEQLGLGSDDLLLYDGAEQYSFLSSGSRMLSRKQTSGQNSRSQTKGKPRLGNEFPSASLMADVLEQDPYNGFDIMDQDRPSLRKKVKGRHGRLPPELSDSELEQGLQSQWEKDRDKKRLRKQEREEMRAQGLLGKKGKLGMKAKYPTGMPLADMKDAIKAFLESMEEKYVTALS